MKDTHINQKRLDIVTSGLLRNEKFFEQLRTRVIENLHEAIPASVVESLPTDVWQNFVMRHIGVGLRHCAYQVSLGMRAFDLDDEQLIIGEMATALDATSPDPNAVANAIDELDAATAALDDPLEAV